MNYIDSFANGKQSVNEGIFVSLGGQEQYLLIQGEDTANPVIIWLHGGPSSPDTFVNYPEKVSAYIGAGRIYYRF